MFTLRIKATDLPTAPRVPNYLPVPSLTSSAPTVFTRSASLFPEHTCLEAICCFLRYTLNSSSLLKHHFPVRPYLTPLFIYCKAPSPPPPVLPVLPPFDIWQLTHLVPCSSPTHQLHEAVISFLVTAAPQSQHRPGFTHIGPLLSIHCMMA